MEIYANGRVAIIINSCRTKDHVGGQTIDRQRDDVDHLHFIITRLLFRIMTNIYL